MSAATAMYQKGGFVPQLQKMAESDLLRAAKAGNSCAFTELSCRHSQHVYRTILRITKNAEDAEDALQNTLLNAYKNLQRFDERSGFPTWFRRIGINAALGILRKRRGCREISVVGRQDEEGALGEWEPVDSTPNPEEQYLDCELTERLHSAIGRLPSSYRSRTQLQLSDDMSVKELADLVGISVAATKSRTLRAKKMLRTNLLPGRNLPNVCAH